MNIFIRIRRHLANGANGASLVRLEQNVHSLLDTLLLKGRPKKGRLGSCPPSTHSVMWVFICECSIRFNYLFSDYLTPICSLTISHLFFTTVFYKSSLHAALLTAVDETNSSKISIVDDRGTNSPNRVRRAYCAVTQLGVHKNLVEGAHVTVGSLSEPSSNNPFSLMNTSNATAQQ